jgi:hypothetical protein
VARKDLKNKPLVEAILEIKWRLIQPMKPPGPAQMLMLAADPHYRLRTRRNTLTRNPTLGNAQWFPNKSPLGFRPTSRHTGETGRRGREWPGPAGRAQAVAGQTANGDPHGESVHKSACRMADGRWQMAANVPTLTDGPAHRDLGPTSQPWPRPATWFS